MNVNNKLKRLYLLLLLKRKAQYLLAVYLSYPVKMNAIFVLTEHFMWIFLSKSWSLQVFCSIRHLWIEFFSFQPKTQYKFKHFSFCFCQFFYRDSCLQLISQFLFVESLIYQILFACISVYNTVFLLQIHKSSLLIFE